MPNVKWYPTDNARNSLCDCDVSTNQCTRWLSMAKQWISFHACFIQNFLIERKLVLIRPKGVIQKNKKTKWGPKRQAPSHKKCFAKTSLSGYFSCMSDYFIYRIMFWNFQRHLKNIPWLAQWVFILSYMFQGSHPV